MVILFDCTMTGAERKIRDLATSARQNGLSFQYEIGKWDVSVEPITEMVNRLSRGLESLTVRRFRPLRDTGNQEECHGKERQAYRADQQE